MMSAQANMATIDPSLYGMMFPMIQNPMMQQLPSLGRGHPIGMQQKVEGQNVQLLPGLQSMMNSGLANVTCNQNVNNNLGSMITSGQTINPGLQNMSTSVAGLSNMNMGIPDLQTLMNMPNLQTVMTNSAQQVPNIQANPRLQTPQTIPPMANLQNMANMGGVPSMPSMTNMSALGNLGLHGMTGMGSGQDCSSQNMAMLPELIPLLNNLNMGTNPNQGNSQ